MKIAITKTSDWDYCEVKEYNSLSECVEELLNNNENFPHFSPEVVVSHPDDITPKKGQGCQYIVEIYDTWRE